MSYRHAADSVNNHHPHGFHPHEPLEHDHHHHQQPQQQQQQQQQQQPGLTVGSQVPPFVEFDLFSWYPLYVSCQRYFLDHAQHSGPVQAVAAFLNIHLPFQRQPPTASSTVIPSAQATQVNSKLSVATGTGPASHLAPQSSSAAAAAAAATSSSALPGSYTPAPSVSLAPYIRRLVVTGLDFPGVLHGFFGDDWAAGVGPLHEQERRNYLFAAKSGGWGKVKRDYDISPLETVPFLRPLQGVVEQEVVAAEKSWSEFMAFEDWMVGPRAPAPKDTNNSSS